eukprot:5261971-Amphidinium_carterae.1
MHNDAHHVYPFELLCIFVPEARATWICNLAGLFATYAYVGVGVCALSTKFHDSVGRWMLRKMKLRLKQVVFNWKLLSRARAWVSLTDPRFCPSHNNSRYTNHNHNSHLLWPVAYDFRVMIPLF